jgi:hypothetical protein
MNRRGQGLAIGLISMMVGLIILVAVVVPVIKAVTSDLGLTGVNKTIADLFITLLLVGGMMLIVYMFFSGRR